MGVINRLPWGFQDLLGATSQGKNPSNLLDDVRPSVDMMPFWSPERLTMARNTGNLSARGQSVLLTIPDGEWWMPLAANCLLNGVNDVGTVFDMSLTLVRLQGATAFPFRISSSGEITTSVIGQIVSHAYQWNTRYLLPPGIEIRNQLNEYVPGVAGPDTFEIQVLYLLLNN